MADLKAYEADEVDLSRQPDEAELAGKPVFGRGVAAEHPFGVLYQGEFETPWDGTGVAVRKHARALALTGIPVQLRSFSNVVVSASGMPEPVHVAGLPDEIDAEVGDLRQTSITLQVPLIKHAVIRDATHARQIIVPRSTLGETDPARALILRRAIGQMTILYTVWERDSIGSDVVTELNRVGQLWVPCDQNAQMLISSGLDESKVRVVPHPYDPADPMLLLQSRKPHTNGWKLFYSIGRWEPRKGFAELIEAFVCGFKPSNKVVLTIKHSGNEWKDYPTPKEAVALALAKQEHGWTAETLGPRLRILSGRAPRETIVGLHFENNIYVSSSHGEAWCLPAFDAKLAGNALVYTDYGGISDFADPKDIGIPTMLGPVHPSYGWTDTQWGDYSVHQFGYAMMRQPIPEKFDAPTHVLERFSMARVGRLMAEQLLALTEEVCPQAHAYYRSRM
jgi:glycosyltransferase involved in cell wall biosynthesis